MRNRLTILPAFLWCTACASLPAQPGYHLVKFTSEPPGAVVRIAEQRCATPCSLALAPGEHPAKIETGTLSRTLVVAPGKDGKRVAATFQLVLGNTLHATGAVLNAVGEVGMQVVRSGGSFGGNETEAAVFITVGLVSIGSAAVGKVMIKAGQAMVDDTAPRPTEVHVVLGAF